MRKPAFSIYAKTKAQISCKVTEQLISDLVFTSWIEQPLFFLNLKCQASIAIFCGCTAWFVPDLVRNPKDMFSRIERSSYDTWFPSPVIPCNHVYAIHQIISVFRHVVRLRKTTGHSADDDILLTRGCCVILGYHRGCFHRLRG